MSLAFFGKGIGTLGWAVVADTSPKEVIGLSGSIFNMFGNVAGIVTPIVIGYLVAETGSFNGALAFVGVNALITVFSYLGDREGHQARGTEAHVTCAGSLFCRLRIRKRRPRGRPSCFQRSVTSIFSAAPFAITSSRRSTLGCAPSRLRASAVCSANTREAMFGGFRIERAEGLLKVVVDRERALFSGLVFDAREHRARCIHQIDTFDAVDRGQLREVVLECPGRLNHEKLRVMD